MRLDLILSLYLPYNSKQAKLFYFAHYLSQFTVFFRKSFKTYFKLYYTCNFNFVSDSLFCISPCSRSKRSIQTSNSDSALSNDIFCTCWKNCHRPRSWWKVWVRAECLSNKFCCINNEDLLILLLKLDLIFK